MIHPFLFLQWIEEQLHLHIGEHVIYTWLVMAILIVVSFLATKSISMIPSGAQNFLEVVITGIDGLIEETMGKEGKAYFPLIATIALFILICNLIGLVPGFYPPTANLNTNAAMALVVFAMTHIVGFRKHGIGYLKHFMGPIIWLAPLMLSLIHI